MKKINDIETNLFFSPHFNRGTSLIDKIIKILELVRVEMKNYKDTERHHQLLVIFTGKRKK